MEKFQFLYGIILTVLDSHDEPIEFLFQFLYGIILTQIKEDIRGKRGNFNSYMELF